MILTAFSKALGQVGDPRFRRVLWRGIGLTIALLVGAYAALLGLIEWLAGGPIELPIVGEVTWVGDLLSFGSLAVMLIVSVFLMIPVASAITSLFLDEVATAVEEKHYPEIGTPPRTPFWDGLRDTVNFLGVLLLANIAALVLYIFLPFASIFIFWAVNGFLLGREYFTLAAMRRLGREDAIALRKEHVATIWMAGTLMAIPLTVPLLNLVIPIIGAATFTHLFHALSGNRATV